MGTKKKTIMKNGPKLLIVESPAKIKTISKFLGKDFKIMSTVGHIKDLPSKKLGITRNEKTGEIDLEYVTIKGKESTILDICRQARKSSEVYLATDPDREGEIISWHIAQDIEKVFPDENKIHRITFNEITEPAIKQAIKDQSTINERQVAAQQARRALDRWVGFEVSPILWKKLAKGLSAGRVQSVALLVICNRDEEIKAFKPEESWSIQALFTLKSNDDLPAELFKISNKAFKLKNKDQAEAALKAIKAEKTFSIDKITEKQRLKKPTAPFMTSTLQQDAYNKLGFSVDRTMSIAQRLYEGQPLSDPSKPEALITYMRTDSLRISDTAIKAARAYIKKEYGEKYLPKTAIKYGKGKQDAHEAIRPINVHVTPEIAQKYLKPEQAKLYGLIWKRFMGCQMTPAEYFQRQVLIKGGKFLFKATGSTLIFDGFLKVYLVEDEDSKTSTNIPKDIKEQDHVDLKKTDSKQHFTQPPPRYNEASLVKELEKQGVGRPSTYATILSTIQKRNYVEKDKKRFNPTELGKAVNEMLTTNLPDIINISFTAQMEEDLDKIARGETERDTVLNEFYEKFEKDLVDFGGKQVSRKNIETELDCPDCKQHKLTIRFGKAGEFVGCMGYPECKFTSNFTKDENGTITLVEPEAPEASDIKCPNCKNNLVKKMGRFGPFLACPGYPDCKYIHQDKLKMKCPKDNNDLVKRRWRGGSFWGCAGYPKCRFSIFGEVIEKPCPKCKTPYLLVLKDKKTGVETYSCPDKECGYNEQAKETSE